MRTQQTSEPVFDNDDVLILGLPNAVDADQTTARSLFGEILDWMLAPLLLLWPMSIAVTYLVAKSIANGPFDRALESSTMVLAQQVKEVNGRVSLHLPITAREILRADETDNIYYLVVGPNDEYISGDRDLPLPFDEMKPHTGLVQFRDDRIGGNDIRIAFMHLRNPMVADGRPVLVQVAETLDKRAQLANEIIKGVILPQFVILPLAVILVWFGLTRGLSPLNDLQKRIRARRADDMSPIDDRAAPQEILPLLAAFNDLLAQLDHSIQAQKRFIADAAHQMKTPLAGLRMQAELAQREQSPEELRRSLQLIADGSERAAHLVKQLLSLARMENPTGSAPTLELLDLSGLSRNTVEEWLSTAWSKQIDLGFSEPDHPLIIEGQALMLREMLNNLIDNAIRYTPEHGHVTVRVQTDTTGERILLDVDDTGPGIPPAERANVVQRFYRILGDNAEGSGLGLAIVKEIVQQHGAELNILDYVYAVRPKMVGTRMRIAFRKPAQFTDGEFR